MIPGLDRVGYLTNQTLFSLDTIPETLLIIGGGYIACEMGQALARLGSKVTIVERGERLLKREDAELVALLTDAMREEGITILTGTGVEGVNPFDNRGNRATLLSSDGTTRGLSFTDVLVATGRKGNTAGLGLEGIGVACDDRGYVTVDAAGRTGVSHIWAGGDVTGKNQFSHMAEEEAKALVRNILFPGTQAIPGNLVPYAVFTDPELAQVGLTEEQAIAAYGREKVTVLRHAFRQDDRAIVEGQTTGMVKVIATGPTGRVVGASILGPRAGELIQEWVLAIQHRLTVPAIAGTVHVYPTLTVSNQRAAQKWFTGITTQPLVRTALSNLFGLNPRETSHL
jgi:pyruvate/2-oxoglutarate dehydrogenase complex dihydrolipoamide dehydrogenase (E3) component